MEGAEKRAPVYAAARGGKRLHVGLQEFSEDMSASFSAGAAKASTVLFSSFSSLRLAASAVGNAVTIKRIEPKVEEEGASSHPSISSLPPVHGEDRAGCCGFVHMSCLRG